MRKLTCALLTFAIILSLGSQAFAWGDEGHRTVGEVAALYITADHDTATLEWVKQTLKGQSLGNAATWADDIKFSPPQDADGKLFVDKAGNHNKWHYVDLPIGCADFDTCDKSFRPEPEIVGRINACIDALLGSPAAGDPLNKRNAMRMLAHLLGDIHQPLHVGVEYVHWDGHSPSFNTDPARILGDNPRDDVTIGGNKLMLKTDDTLELHVYWDTNLVLSAMSADGATSPSVFASHLREKFKQPPGWDNSGDIKTWGAQWATEALKLSEAHAYPTVELLGRRKGDPFNPGKKTMWVYDIKVGDSYERDNTPVVRDQLAKAGYRLAKLLEAIHARMASGPASMVAPSESGGGGGSPTRRARQRRRGRHTRR
jgi:hypothetical protein